MTLPTKFFQKDFFGSKVAVPVRTLYLHTYTYYANRGEATMNICVDCAMAHANNDFTGMDNATEARVRAGMAVTGPLAVITDEFHEFSWTPCWACGDRHGGSRFMAESY